MTELLARYSFRRSALEQERSYSLYPDRIVVEGADFAPYTYPLADVQSVHLKYEHTKQREYYQCFIATRRGRINLRHVHWDSFASFHDRGDQYTPFVKAVLAQLAKYPNVRYKAGSVMNFGCAILGAPLMAGLCLLCIRLGRTGSAILAGIMAAICVIMIGPSRPRPLDPLAPPDDLLP